MRSYYDYDPTETKRCPGCRWSGPAADTEELHMDAGILDLGCPRCDHHFGHVVLPTRDDVRAAAAAGNPKAIADLPAIEQIEARWARAAELRLTDPAQLPELHGRRIVVDWDLESADDEQWTVLRLGARVLWRELALYEGYRRFVEIARLLGARYGKRIVDLRPTDRSEVYLYGDKLSSPETVERARAQLRRGKLARHTGAARYGLDVDGAAREGRPRLYINRALAEDWLICLEWGRVSDGLTSDYYVPIDDDEGRIAYVLDEPGGRIVGFEIREFSTLDADDPALEDDDGAPRFNAPFLRLADASLGDIARAALERFRDAATPNRELFALACQARGRDALELWREVLALGDQMAECSIGYTLAELGEYEEARERLAHYTLLAPAQPWGWCWLGRALEGLGRPAEAFGAYARALRLTAAGGEGTDAARLAGSLFEHSVLRAVRDSGIGFRRHSAANGTPAILLDWPSGPLQLEVTETGLTLTAEVARLQDPAAMDPKPKPLWGILFLIHEPGDDSVRLLHHADWLLNASSLRDACGRLADAAADCRRRIEACAIETTAPRTFDEHARAVTVAAIGPDLAALLDALKVRYDTWKVDGHAGALLDWPGDPVIVGGGEDELLIGVEVARAGAHAPEDTDLESYVDLPPDCGRLTYDVDCRRAWIALTTPALISPDALRHAIERAVAAAALARGELLAHDHLGFAPPLDYPTRLAYGPW